jgi:hypothetical protein
LSAAETDSEADAQIEPEALHRGDAGGAERGVGTEMSVLQELNTIVENAGLPVETGVFSGTAPDEYVVVTPVSEQFDLFSDNAPGVNIEEARLSLYTKGSYIDKKDLLVRTLLTAGFTITDRRYIEHEDDTGYYHYAIDVAKEYEQEEI